MNLVGRVRVGLSGLTIPPELSPFRGMVVIEVVDDQIIIMQAPTLCCLCDKEIPILYYWGRGVCVQCLDILKKNLPLWM